MDELKKGSVGRHRIDFDDFGKSGCFCQGNGG